MGTVLSKRLSPRERLARSETEAEQIQNTLSRISDPTTSRWFYVITVWSLLTVGAISLAISVPLTPALLSVFFVAVLMRLLFAAITRYRISRARGRLSRLRASQKELILELKKDEDFQLAQSLIEKYEDEESRESFFQHVRKRRRGAMEKIADFVLENDPAKMNALICKYCGIHNGLVDPENDEFAYFYCYSCRKKNQRGPK